MSDLYLVIDIVIAFGLLALALASSVRRGFRNPVNRLFALFSMLIAFWIVSNHVSNDVDIPKNFALIANYFVFSSAFGVSILLMQFIVRLVGARKLEIIVKRSLSLLWFICLICFTPLIVADISIQKDVYAITFGSFISLYAAGILFNITMITYGLIYGLRFLRGIKRRQLISVGIGLILCVPLIVSIDFVIPMLTGNFEITEFGITPMIILVGCLYYGVIKYSLFDIRLAFVRTMAYALSLLTMSFAYYYIAYLMSILFFRGDVGTSFSISPLNIMLALLLAFIFQPIKKFFDKITNSIFYKDIYNTDDFFAHLNKTLTITTDLRDLLIRAAEEIGSTLKSDQTFFFINTSDDHYITAGTSGHTQLPKKDALKLNECTNTNEGVIVAALLNSNDPIHRLMLSHKIELALPLKQGGRVLGYLCLGSHRNSGYKMRDMKVLTTISDELVIAIQNALSIQEVKDLNENLQMRIDAATKELRASNAQLQRLDKAKDEFVSMASHQLRTPLTSIKGYVSMILDGDVGEINDTMRHMLDEAFMSSERMVNLINDFLNMSRIQTGKFMIEKVSVDLSKVIKQEIDSLQPSAIAHDLRFEYKQPANFPMVSVDEGKIRQVIMNFADNAIYYSKPNTKIDIIVESNKDTISFMVKDHGIGVPESEQANLFTKFFRAANAKKQRPDGTGVGLYLAKRIVDAHDGRIIFESTEGQGSTFGFSIPIKQA